MGIGDWGLGAETVYAEPVIAKGQIPAGYTNVRIRTESNTNCNIITEKNGGFTFDILQVVKTSDTYDWYKIGFNHEGSYTTGYIFGEYVQVLNDYNYEENTDFEAYLNKQGFPESYKAGLRQIHAQYPKWNFVARKISVDWNTFINNENVNGRSLVSGSSISSWKSIDAGCYDWETDTYVAKDSGNWVQASKELGCTGTHFANTNGLWMANHYTTAHDMAIIARAAYKNPTFAKITGTKRYNIEKTNKNKRLCLQT